MSIDDAADVEDVASASVRLAAEIRKLRKAAGLSQPQLAGAWQPPQLLPAERRSHYFIDLARAQVAIGRYDHAHDALRAARQIAPQQVREHPHVRQSLKTLVRTRPKDTELVNFANWVRVSPR